MDNSWAVVAVSIVVLCVVVAAIVDCCVVSIVERCVVVVVAIVERWTHRGGERGERTRGIRQMFAGNYIRPG